MVLLYGDDDDDDDDDDFTRVYIFAKSTVNVC